MKKLIALTITLVILFIRSFAQPAIYVNQVGFDTKGPKIAVVGVDHKFTRKTIFSVINTLTNQTEFTGVLSGPQTIDEWTPGKFYYQADFSAFQKIGKYAVRVESEGKASTSFPFSVEENAFGETDHFIHHSLL